MMAIVLCADDYAITASVSRGIEELAEAGRLSATSALVTGPYWPALGHRVATLRAHVQVGLHLNLTLGRPLGPLPKLAQSGTLPAIAAITASALARRIDRPEIEGEIERQIEAFRTHAGRDPDFVDGHQHVHALPVVREAVVAALDKAFPRTGPRPWVRDPADRAPAILARGHQTAKALALSTLAHGFGKTVRAAGFVTNRGFAGVSGFDRRIAFERELDAFMKAPGPAHLVMCHPGHADDELAALDPVVERREDELHALMSADWLEGRIVTGGESWPAGEATL